MSPTLEFMSLAAALALVIWVGLECALSFVAGASARDADEDAPDTVRDVSIPCDRPPSGWYCTRTPGHIGSCAARRMPDA